MNSAQSLYTTTAADISGIVSQLQTYADSLHDVNPDDVNFGHAAELGRVQNALSELIEILGLK